MALLLAHVSINSMKKHRRGVANNFVQSANARKPVAKTQCKIYIIDSM